jgi:Permuted papain-like amidase enzyme, YaeF/YiiX, C92 family
MPQLGDIVLFRSGTKGASVNRMAQSIARLKKSQVNHVALTYGSHTLVDAQPNLGIEAHSIAESIKKNLPGSFTVLRNRVLSSDDNLKSKLRSYVLESIGDRYNWLFLLGERKEYSFCSEFVGRAFEHIKLGLAFKAPAEILPSDLEYLAKRADWVNVSKEYISYLTPKEFEGHSASSLKILQESEAVMREAEVEFELSWIASLDSLRERSRAKRNAK